MQTKCPWRVRVSAGSPYGESLRHIFICGSSTLISPNSSLDTNAKIKNTGRKKESNQYKPTKLLQNSVNIFSHSREKHELKIKENDDDDIKKRSLQRENSALTWSKRPFDAIKKAR